ncbi:cytochrome P450 [Streptomyces sp. CAU 1734]|uniref:cytochrome P450 n=1 Tax=Streptomyces sp. CAU 1734 TaxID=3140360 RepID=UPI00326027F6
MDSTKSPISTNPAGRPGSADLRDVTGPKPGTADPKPDPGPGPQPGPVDPGPDPNSGPAGPNSRTGVRDTASRAAARPAPHLTPVPTPAPARRRLPGTVPERGAIPVLGHALRVPDDAFTQFAMEEARALGPIYTLRFFGEESLMVSGEDLVAELCDETRFRKSIKGLEPVREFGGDGLFTALGHEPNWRKAHNILMPAFSFNALRAYHPTMLLAARRLLAAWDAGAGKPVDVAEDMTRLTLDTIGLCGFGHDFDCFGRSEPHPFISAMVRALDHAQRKAGFIPGLDFLHAGAEKRQRADIASMNSLVDDIVRRRRAGAGESGPDAGEPEDLLGLMLHAVDKETGEPLDDTNIRYQVITFLIAGHETTSGALSFALHYLLKHPEVLAAAQAETDALWGDDPDPDPSYEDVGRLRYLRQVLNETLRLWPTAPAFGVEALEDTVIGGRYPISRGQGAVVITPMLHRQPGWGDNPELFDPGRFTPERIESRGPHLYKPFGSGERSCIGRQFALHEATLLLGLLVHRYRLIDHSGYQLKIKETLTLKPDGFTLTPVRRTVRDRAGAVRRTEPAAVRPADPGTAGLRAPGTTVTVLYGSNLGTCRTLAADLAEQGARLGFTTVPARLDDAVGTLAPDRPVLIVTASYNGRPTDDAGRFVDWLESGGPPAGIPYAVLGVGDRNWSATYQRIPTLVDERMAAAGGEALAPRAAIDVSGDVAAETGRWSGLVWSGLLARYGVPAPAADAPEAPAGPRHTVEDAPDAPADPGLPDAGDGLLPLTVTETAELCDLAHPLGRSKRFLTLRLPEGTAYRTGDHLLVRPENPAEPVERTARILGLDPARTVVLRPAGPHRGGGFPVGRPLTVRTLLTRFTELTRPATAGQLTALAALSPCPPDRAALTALAGAGDGATVTDLLERFPSCRPSLAELLDVLTPMAPRYYSISSSPALAPGAVDLMVAAAPVPHRRGEGTFLGTGAAHLAGLAPGDTVYGRVTPCADPFRLPADPAVPVILVAAGTGLAPFRAAVADRAAAPAAGRAPLFLYFGCDHPDADYLHRAELEAAEERDAVSLRPVHSRAPRDGAQFVQDRILRESAELGPLLEAGAHIRVCGDGRAMAPAVRNAFRAVRAVHTGESPAETESWLDSLIAEGRYVEDVWAG